VTAPLSSQAQKLINRDRRTLARSITKIESTRPDDRARAEDLIDEILPYTGGSIRLGISGTPGVGKSTMIDAFGVWLIQNGHRVAVLAVDPSSSITGGSILGDKTRMTALSSRSESFIRPTPSGGAVGGVARRTRDAMLLCEAAGFDVVIVETMGVGQAETTVAEICDLFLLLVAPGGGDDLQGIKRGVMELADVVAVNKSDGKLLDQARHTAADYRQALHLMRPRWDGVTTSVLNISAHTGDGMAQLWETLSSTHAGLSDEGHLGALRSSQAVSQLRREFESMVSERITRLPTFAKFQANIERAVAEGTQSPSKGAATLAQLAWRELS